MFTTFSPRLDVLPAAQQRLWPELKSVPSSFVLYGGTALALRLGHRSSADFDFFSNEPFAATDLLAAAPFLQQGQVVQRHGQTLSVVVQRGGPVKISFFSGLTFGCLAPPERAGAAGLKVASLLDLAGTKAAVVQMRAEAKDYLDVAALLKHGITLPQALGAAQALYGEQFNPLLTLKSLAYFEDGDLPRLPEDVKALLVAAVADTREVPTVPQVADRIIPPDA